MCSCTTRNVVIFSIPQYQTYNLAKWFKDFWAIILDRNSVKGFIPCYPLVVYLFDRRLSNQQFLIITVVYIKLTCFNFRRIGIQCASNVSVLSIRQMVSIR